MSSPLRWGLLTWALVVGSLSVSCGQAFGPESVASAFQRAYPGWVEVVPGTGDPLFRIDGQLFAWAQGRLLPWEQRESWNTYSPQPFYDYPAAEPDVASWTDGELAQAEARLADRRSDAPKRSSSFFDALWSARDRGSADAAQRRIRFLGLPVTVHRSLVAALGRIEARLKTLRATDPTLDAFLGNLKGLDGYNWRDIAETQSRSNHAYGAAIDLVPRSYGGKTPYWLWAPQDKPGWYRTAWARRWAVPPGLVKSFEAEGFVWGGKWLLFDTIHFEYRPEILILNGRR